MPEKAFSTGKGPNGALISQERGILGSPLPRLSETHPTFCGHYSLDKQDRLSRNSPVKKQCLINNFGGFLKFNRSSAFANQVRITSASDSDMRDIGTGI
jgi:hypothetical protein